MNIKSVECRACDGTGHSPVPVRPWVDRNGVERCRYPACSYCGGERYVSKEASARFRHRIR